MTLIPSRKQVIREARERGEMVAAVLPIHYPRALFRAFGIHPVEVWGPPAINTTKGESHVQAYTCSIVRNSLAFLLNGGLDEADMILVPHACDSLQGLGSLLLDFTLPKQKVLTLYLPRSRRPSDRVYLEQELASLGRQLGELTGRSPSEEDWRQALELDDRAAALQAELSAFRSRLPLSDQAFYRVYRSREFLPPDQFINLAESTLESRESRSVRTGLPILLSGYVPEPWTLLDTLEEAGARVVGDDLAACSRRVYPPGTSESPYARIAESLLSGPPDPMMGASIAERVRYLGDLAEQSGARGVIFYEIKFCEPELFQLPLVRKGMEMAGFPSLVVEIDINDPLPQQVVTRLQAFVEMIA